MSVSKFFSKNPYIEYYFIVKDEFPQPYRSIQMFPDGKSVMVFNLGEQLSEKGKILPSSLVSSGCSQSHTIEFLGGKIDLIGIQFKPYGIFPFLPKSANRVLDISNEIHSLPLVFGDFIEEIEEALKTAKNTNEKIALLEVFFHSKMMFDIEDNVRKFIDSITHNSLSYNINDISKEYGITVRTIERYFEKYVGISPKKYLKIVRFKNIVTILKLNPQQNLTSLSYDFGYTDQSHFIKEFREFALINPSLFQKNIPVSDFYNFER